MTRIDAIQAQLARFLYRPPAESTPARPKTTRSKPAKSGTGEAAAVANDPDRSGLADQSQDVASDLESDLEFDGLADNSFGLGHKEQCKQLKNRFEPDIRKLPATLRPLALFLIGCNDKGEPLPQRWRSSEAEQKLLASLFGRYAAQLEKLSPADRQRVISVFLPGAATSIEAGWQWLKSQPYSIGYWRTAFRAPQHPAATLSRRFEWLRELIRVTSGYRSECVTPAWLAAWGGHAFGQRESVAVPVLVAAMNSKGKEGDQVFEILRQTVTREHATAVMSEMTVASLLCGNRPEGWDLMEKTLLAAQRQEGLRQWITQNTDHAHPEAFVRMLRLIVDQDLLRFSAVARSVNSWFRLQWDSVSVRVLTGYVTEVLRFIESPADRRKALSSGDPETVYRALWASAHEDAVGTISLARQLLRHKSYEIRFVAVWILTLIGLKEADQVRATMLDDPSLEVAVMAAVPIPGVPMPVDAAGLMAGESGDEPEGQAGNPRAGKERFEALERLYHRLPEKPQTLKPVVWPWTERKIGRSMIAGLLLDALGDLPPTRMLPFLKGLDAWQQRRLIGLLAAQKKWDALTRTTLFDLLGHASPNVREAAFHALQKEQLKADEWARVEGYLSRSAADLRKGCLEMIARAGDAQVLASAGRLLAARDRNTRLAGLELCRQLAVGNRCRAGVQSLVETWQARQKKLVAEEENQLKAIADSGREVLTLENGLGLFNPAGLSQPFQPKPRKVPLITKAAIACIESLDALVHQHQKEPVRIDRLFGPEDRLLGELQGWQLPGIDPEKPLKPQLERFPLIERWQEWLANRPARCRDKDGLELLRAIHIGRLLSSGRFPAALAWMKKKPIHGQTVLRVAGEVSIGKTYHLSLTVEILEALFYSNIPEGVVDYLLDCTENSFAAIPEEILRTAIPDPAKKDEEQTSRFACFDDDDDGVRDWRENPLLNLWLEALDGHLATTRVRMTESQKRRDWDLRLFYDRPVAGAARRRPELGTILSAFQSGFANRDDVLDALICPATGCKPFGNLATLTERNPSTQTRKYFADDQRLAPLVNEVRERVYEVEISRGEARTAASEAALAIGELVGTERLFRTLAALGKNGFRVESSYGRSAADNRISALTHLVRINYPSGSDTVDQFRKHVREATAAGYCTEQRLIELAFLAPQWTRFVEATLNWSGFSEGLYWFLAHMQVWGGDGKEAAAEAEGVAGDPADEKSGQEDFSGADDRPEGASMDSVAKPRRMSSWARLILERTPLTPAERCDGAIDVAWFRRIYAALGDRRFLAMAEAARLAANPAQARKAQFLADVLRGRVKRQELVDGIVKRNLKDYVRLLGLLPLAGGAKRDGDLQERYRVLQGYKKYARGLSSLTKPGAMRAVEVGMQNLARLAGYADPLRMEWALEAGSFGDLAAGPVAVTKEGVTVTLQLDPDARPQITVEKDGKPIKSIPAPLMKKHPDIAGLADRAAELKRSASRMAHSLESAMCRSDTLTGAELVRLSSHPILAPLLGRLVLLGDGIAGYPDKGGKALRDHSGKLEPVKKDEVLRIAHPADLFERGDWGRWQRECLASERVQPFKQVFREFYPVTAQELKDQTQSNRFAGQQINPRQAMALWNRRGWNTEDSVCRIFHDLSLIAEVSFQYSHGTAAEIEGLTIEAVQFRKRDELKPLRLADIPAVVFSEVMRDMDLVVSVAHRGEVDPEASASTIEMRAALLRETTQLLGLRNVSFKPAHAIIQGHYGEYSVHLGSAIAHRLPGGALNILPIPAQHRGRLFLPFADDDPRTAELVSKVLLLARDGEILDPGILDQIAAPVGRRPVGLKAPATRLSGAQQKAKARADEGKAADSASGGRRHFEFVEGKSGKFWEIEISGNTVTTCWGRIGTNGQSEAKTFADESKAKAEYDRLIAEQSGKGYIEQ